MKLLTALLSGFILILATATASADDALVEKRFKDLEGEFLVGPASVNIAGQATLKLQEGLVYIRRATLEKIFAGTAQKWPDGMDGLIMPDETGGKTVTDSWGAAGILYSAEGHIDDKDAQKLNTDAMLTALKKNTEKSNEQRRKAGLPALEVVGWHQAPAYDSKTHKIQWSLLQRDVGNPESTKIIFNTLSLGREGTLSFLVMIPKDKLSTHGTVASDILSGISFDAGRRYEDFDPAHDKKAKSTLTSLIEQANGMHLGLIALVIGLLAKFGKVIAIALVGGAAAIRALKKKKAA